MEQLIDQMKKLLAESYAFYLKTHYYHWNVEDEDFPMWHTFFEGIYTEVYGAVDDIAEHIRQIGGYAPGSFGRFRELSTIQDETGLPEVPQMLQQLIADNQTVIFTLHAAYKLAENAGEIGLSNFIQDREAAHKKHAWMLKACLGKQK
jgi:starvation-inducible DNA-binding protein